MNNRLLRENGIGTMRNMNSAISAIRSMNTCGLIAVSANIDHHPAEALKEEAGVKATYQCVVERHRDGCWEAPRASSRLRGGCFWVVERLQ